MSDENTESRSDMDYAGSILPTDTSVRLFKLFWQLEAWLREMVYVELRSRELAWESAVVGAKTTADPKAKAADKRLVHMTTRHEGLLSYLTMGQVLSTIRSDANWPLFEAYFMPKSIFEARLEEVAQIRHRIAHFREPNPTDLDRVILFLKDIDKGVWRFCASYSKEKWILTDGQHDPVFDYIESTHPSRRHLFETHLPDGRWLHAGNRDPRIGFSPQFSFRPWAPPSGVPLAGKAGILYHFSFYAIRTPAHFDHRRILEYTSSVHQNCCHIRLDSDRGIEVTIPAVLGEDAVIETLEPFIRACPDALVHARNTVGRSLADLAREAPEYVLPPGHPLGLLSDDRPCRMFQLLEEV